MRRKYLLTAGLVLVAAVLTVEFIPLGATFTEERWVGGYNLTVHLDAPAGSPSVVICGATFWPPEAVEKEVALLRTLSTSSRLIEPPSWSSIWGREAVAAPFRGGPLTVRINTHGASLVGTCRP